MAARTGASVGVAVTITILAILSLTLFILTMVFFGQAQSAGRDLRAAQDEVRDFIRPEEREAERVRTVVNRATQERQSAVGYLLERSRETMNIASGNPDLRVEQLRERKNALEGGEGASLMDLLTRRDREIARLSTELDAADRDRRVAQDDARNEAQRVAAIEERYEETAGDLRGLVGDYQERIEGYRDRVDQLERRMQQDIERIAAESSRRQSELQERISGLNEENLVLQDQLRRLRGERPAERVSPRAEYALVDGTVDQVIGADNEAVISIGRRNNVVLGMSFAVYGDSSQIRPDPETGEYAEGKGVIEVINVQENFSRARILREARGNPIVRGDVIANALYDPDKTYSFVVFGNFDTNNDGQATPQGREDVIALIERWGGEVVDDITGGLDFLVLGERPVVPPAPAPGSPIDVLNEYVRLQRVVSRYDDLFQTAFNTSIPVLNHNRLRTLIGDMPN